MAGPVHKLLGPLTAVQSNSIVDNDALLLDTSDKATIVTGRQADVVNEIDSQPIEGASLAVGCCVDIFLQKSVELIS